MRKKIHIITLLLLLLFTPSIVTAQTVTCDSLGYTDTATYCNSKSLKYLICPYDSTKVYCGQKKTCEDGGYKSSTSEGEVGCTTVSYAGNTCYTGCTSCLGTYNRLNFDYTKVIGGVSGSLCSTYTAWNGIRMPVGMDETCEEFKPRILQEVNAYNSSICGTQYKKITSSPSNINCYNCCKNGNMMICVNEL
ncbi:MAG: hypothetical protein ACK5N8_04105 [Alphaproteobacteria bacterium]